jgi:hypothetical protein
MDKKDKQASAQEAKLTRQEKCIVQFEDTLDKAFTSDAFSAHVFTTAFELKIGGHAVVLLKFKSPKAALKAAEKLCAAESRAIEIKAKHVKAFCAAASLHTVNTDEAKIKASVAIAGAVWDKTVQQCLDYTTGVALLIAVNHSNGKSCRIGRAVGLVPSTRSSEDKIRGFVEALPGNTSQRAVAFAMLTDMAHEVEAMSEQEIIEDAKIGLDAIKRKECWNCKAVRDKLPLCTRCKVARYCSKDCQKTHWKAGHKDECRCLHKIGVAVQSTYHMATQ